ncbi:DUF1707 domain-containing protein [Amycolatopsis sp. NPDC005961]|uniref:DUF1707 domain-containing protein n=1 Tax=Amycolatopsis camponoti TaxID=2606593 RepID=A0A6I8M9J5_9PSEU|nr:DUF1707 domain-containing protein [Amycolatopsis camponoti]VVJ24469.1 Uncharacterised protein [Amycolatopsis camponoti]
MTEVPSPQLRISDQNRESALSALGEHMSAGRIDIDEYGERSARITAAKTRGELVEIFADLPAPHPRYDDAPQAVAAPGPASEAQPAPRQPGAPVGWSGGQRFVAAFLPLVWIATIALIATGVVHGTLILVPIGLSIFGRSMWGHAGHDQHHAHHDHGDRRERHLRDRDRRRELRDSYRDHRRGLDR